MATSTQLRNPLFPPHLWHPNKSGCPSPLSRLCIWPTLLRRRRHISHKYHSWWCRSKISLSSPIPSSPAQLLALYTTPWYCHLPAGCPDRKCNILKYSKSIKWSSRISFRINFHLRVHRPVLQMPRLFSKCFCKMPKWSSSFSSSAHKRFSFVVDVSRVANNAL